MSAQITPRPRTGRFRRWLKRLSLMLAGLLLAAAAWDVASYDAEAWLADYGRIKHDMGQGYANLDWIIAHRGLDPAALDTRTTAALRNAHSRLRAWLALRDFLDAFGDPHLRMQPAQAGDAGAGAAQSDAAAPAVAGCQAAGYEEGDHAFGFPFDQMPGWQFVHGGDFPVGRIADVGVLRIAQFGEQRYARACERVFKPGMDARTLQLAVRGLQQRKLAEALHRLRAAGARRLLVDLTGNGGGSEWVAEVTALMTGGRLSRAAPRQVAPACDRSGVWRNRPHCPGLEPAGERQYLQGTGAWTGPVMILADRSTASASEDLVAWLQQGRVAIVIGERTAGAGCGYVDGGTRTALKVLPLDVVMPNCARLLDNGRNEIEGIEPDVRVDLRADDAPAKLAAALGAG